MKTIEHYHKNSDIIAYQKIIYDSGYWYEITYDEKGNELTYRNSNSYRTERTYDENGNELTYKNSVGYWEEKTYDEKGNQLTFKNFDDDYRIRDRKVTKEEFEAFINLKNIRKINK